MPIQNKPGQGVMFPNDQQGNPNRPAWRGSINIDGKEWEISAWNKVSQRGANYISLEAREPWQGAQQGATAPQPQYQQPQYQQPAPAPQYAPQQTAPAPQYAPQPQPARQAAPRQYAPQPAPAPAPAPQQGAPEDLPF